jgi:hypothetical protein
MNMGLSDCIKWHVGELIKLRMSESSDILSFIGTSYLDFGQYGLSVQIAKLKVKCSSKEETPSVRGSLE